MKILQGTIIFCAVIFTLILSILIHADEFNDVYTQYSKAVKTDDRQKTQKLAEKAVKLGEIKFGAAHKNSFSLRHNLAKAYFNNENTLKAFEEMSTVVEGYAKIHGTNSEEHFYALLELAYFYRPIPKTKYAERRNKIMPILQQLIDVGEDIVKNKPDTSHSIYLELSVTLNNKVLVNFAKKQAKHYAKLTFIDFTETLGSEDMRTLESQLTLAKAMRVNKEFDDARKMYDDIIKKVSVKSKDAQLLEIKAKSQLISLYSQLRNKAKMTELLSEVDDFLLTSNEISEADWEVFPRIRVEPKYPAEVARSRKPGSKKEGWVKLSFSTDKKGFVKDVSVLGSKGPKAFHPAAKNALVQWRFIPKFVNGQAVESQNLDVTLNFKLAR